RELSDLELGELRESTPDETIVAKQFERKGSFKHMENKANTSEDVNSNIAKVKPSLKATLDSGRPTSVLSSGFPSNLENTNKKNVDCHFEDSTKSRSRVMQTQSQPLKADNADVGSQNNLTEMSTKFRNSESGVSHDIDLDGRRESNRRVPANGSKQGTKRGMVSYPVKESKRRTPNSGEEVPEGRKDSVFVDRSNGDQKKRESSSDENSCSYSKFEKEEPELKGPIKTFSQYKEYVQEYRDKYQSYLSLNKILMDYKDEFGKLGVDLENAERSGNQDRYDDIAAQIRESYRRCGSLTISQIVPGALLFYLIALPFCFEQ
ncbi:dentin sialophosphoprotein, partial [Trifolium medium]|nr:dentin sialophosphoprotein [Trifolium medium]